MYPVLHPQHPWLACILAFLVPMPITCPVHIPHPFLHDLKMTFFGFSLSSCHPSWPHTINPFCNAWCHMLLSPTLHVTLSLFLVWNAGNIADPKAFSKGFGVGATLRRMWMQYLPPLPFVNILFHSQFVHEASVPFNNEIAVSGPPCKTYMRGQKVQGSLAAALWQEGPGLQSSRRATLARCRARRRRCRAGIILLKCRNSETCNRKEKTPFRDHLEYLPIQNPLSGRGLGLGGRGGGGAH